VHRDRRPDDEKQRRLQAQPTQKGKSFTRTLSSLAVGLALVYLPSAPRRAKANAFSHPIPNFSRAPAGVCFLFGCALVLRSAIAACASLRRAVTNEMMLLLGFELRLRPCASPTAAANATLRNCKVQLRTHSVQAPTESMSQSQIM
jgi:hypothetical protein